MEEIAGQGHRHHHAAKSQRCKQGRRNVSPGADGNHGLFDFSKGKKNQKKRKTGKACRNHAHAAALHHCQRNLRNLLAFAVRKGDSKVIVPFGKGKGIGIERNDGGLHFSAV